MLPVAGHADGRRCDRHIAADRPDEESGRRHAHLLGRVGDRAFPEFVAQQDRRGAGSAGRARRQDQIALFRTRVAHQGGQRGVPAQDKGFVLRHRRGALHFGVGTRLPPGVPPHPADHQRDRLGAADRPDGYGHAQGAARHPEESGHVRRLGLQIVVQPPEPLLRNPAQAQRRPRRGADRVARGQRHPGAGLPRRDGCVDARRQSGRLPDGARRGDRGDDRFRHGHRQTRRALCHPLRHSQVARRLLPGDGPCRPRRRRGLLPDLLQLQGHPETREVHAGQAHRRTGDRQAAAAGDGFLRREFDVPPQDAAALFRRGLYRGQLRQLRQLPQSQTEGRCPGCATFWWARPRP